MASGLSSQSVQGTWALVDVEGEEQRSTWGARGPCLLHRMVPISLCAHPPTLPTLLNQELARCFPPKQTIPVICLNFASFSMAHLTLTLSL